MAWRERRTTDRRAFAGDIFCSPVGQRDRWPGHMVDVSSSGLGFHLPRSYGEGARLVLTIHQGPTVIVEVVRKTLHRNQCNPWYHGCRILSRVTAQDFPETSPIQEDPVCEVIFNG